MDSTKARYQLATDPARLQQMEALLARYPDIHPEEQSELLDFLRKGPPLDTALLTAVDEIRPKLERFREDHRTAFALGTRHYFWAITILLIVLGLCACLSDAGLQT